jgi:NTE family protein
MARSPHPEVLVLGGGGVLGEAWMTAVLAGLAEASGFDARRCEGYVGTSAGSIVAAGLVAGIDPGSRVTELPEQPALAQSPWSAAGGLASRAVGMSLAASGTVMAPLAALGLRSTEAGGALLRRAALARVADGHMSLSRIGLQLERAGAAWDGRLAIAAVELETGRRVIFGRPDAPQASVAAAVEASCAIPGVFRPVSVDGRRYVDGGVWSPTNLDCARVSRGTEVLCLNPTGSLRPGRGAPFGALGLVSRSLAGVEALALERRGARVKVVSPDSASAGAMGGNLMDASRRSAVSAAAFAQGRAL